MMASLNIQDVSTEDSDQTKSVDMIAALLSFCQKNIDDSDGVFRLMNIMEILKVNVSQMREKILQ
jgi:hypothetical protein